MIVPFVLQIFADVGWRGIYPCTMVKQLSTNWRFSWHKKSGDFRFEIQELEITYFIWLGA
ncbi:MAG: hypothetical protein EAZ60_10325 [Oscillatoriales cyanobacterium]|uniref:hypothetical protein n=1 Tax=Microcoleus sp. PH2017_22_RUC_O_B TaxID=2798833 RepID=UPI001D6F14BF|nr:hypothetical protein [Microcoleus sp. PH2017_22_RUC_O_B]MCC3461631.1 hypothetical protein [Microcoleus sp. PH2017_11_PCY_U_A]MCC3561673.1 hypothetical protein [Microcoleus sp. PH2017_27_LUM_O_A]TAE76226.1 MAG: hypothetical protein EAZ83_28540 [Oscillatoriales cyanobacterium]TAF18029.1 MAG: hypothetical protein EAZ73_18925 [Oscillatoriales cyanobacterium]TAF30129.1 MAG: hypothetical protein EAZ69_23680 [Oscillatoriales cyanobacterium]